MGRQHFSSPFSSSFATSLVAVFTTTLAPTVTRESRLLLFAVVSRVVETCGNLFSSLCFVPFFESDLEPQVTAVGSPVEADTFMAEWNEGPSHDWDGW